MAVPVPVTFPAATIVEPNEFILPVLESGLSINSSSPASAFNDPALVTTFNPVSMISGVVPDASMVPAASLLSAMLLPPMFPAPEMSLLTLTRVTTGAPPTPEILSKKVAPSDTIPLPSSVTLFNVPAALTISVSEALSSEISPVLFMMPSNVTPHPERIETSPEIVSILFVGTTLLLPSKVKLPPASKLKRLPLSAFSVPPIITIG